MLRASSLTRRKINKTSDMIEAILVIVNVVFAAFVWFRIGRQKAFDNLLHDYRQQAKVVQIQEMIIESYKQEYGELTDGGTEQNNKKEGC